MAVSPGSAPVVAPEPIRRLHAAVLTAFAILLATAFGAVLPEHPVEAVALLVLIPVTVLAPAFALSALLFVTVLVPYDVQNRLSLGGDVGRPGLLVVDLLVAIGLVRVAILVGTRRMPLAWPVATAGALLAGFTLALARGVAAGAAPSDAGFDARPLILGAAAFVLAWPLLHDTAERRRLAWALLALGLALGLWGLAQWVFQIDYSASGDVGVRPGIGQDTSLGGGQLQGGLFAYPVAVILSYAALLSKAIEPVWARALVATVFGLNVICALVTYERTVWGASVIGCVLVALALRRGERRGAVRWPAFAAGLILAFMALDAGSLTAATGRVESLLSLRSDSAVTSRAVESRAVVGEIQRAPALGSGLGASVTWGERNVFATTTTTYVHGGYLWLAWKLGIPLAILVVALVAVAAFRRVPRTHDVAARVAHVGCRASLVALLVSSVTFPVFAILGITAAMGVLTAVCIAGVRAS
jgi:hypothetical protein